MRFGSLFAGIGGLDLGLERAGMECAWQVEIDPFCGRVLEKHWPDVPRYEDVRDVGAHNLEPVDLIAGGFPCQDISTANTAAPRSGLAGEKSGLWREMLRVVKETSPSWVLAENSPRWKAWVPHVRADLERLGYQSIAYIISAGALGARHSRPRGFVVANAYSDSKSMLTLNAEVARMSQATGSAWWPPHIPATVRMDDGFPYRVDRLRGVGNAVAPPVAGVFGRAILAASAPKGETA